MMGLPHPFKEDCLTLPLSTRLSSNALTLPQSCKSFCWLLPRDQSSPGTGVASTITTACWTPGNRAGRISWQEAQRQSEEQLASQRQRIYGPQIVDHSKVKMQLNTHAFYVCGFAGSDMTWCMVVWCTQNVLRQQQFYMAQAM